MTGGIGFGGHGRNSYKGNRELLKKRGSMKDNPYSTRKKSNREINDNIEELLEWKRVKEKKETHVRRLIWTGIVIIIFISLLTFLYV